MRAKRKLKHNTRIKSEILFAYLSIFLCLDTKKQSFDFAQDKAAQKFAINRD